MLNTSLNVLVGSNSPIAFKKKQEDFLNIKVKQGLTKSLNSESNIFYSPKISFSGRQFTVPKEIQAEIKEALDNEVFEFVTPAGEKLEGSVADYIKACISKMTENDTAQGLLHGTMQEVRSNIIKNGFDPDKVTRTLAGPGTCFTGSEYEAHMLGGGAVISCDYNGSTARFQHGFYEKIRTNEKIKSIVDEKLGTNIEKYKGWSEAYSSAINKIEKCIDSYTRDVIINKLHIDAGIDPGNYPCYPACFVVYNTKKIHNIQAYN